MKKITGIFCLIATLVVICFAGSITTFAANTDSTDSAVQQQQYLDFNEKNAKNQAEQYVQQWNQMDFSFLKNKAQKEYIKNQAGEDELKCYESWNDVKKEIGTFKKITNTDVTLEDDKAIVKVTADYSKEEVEFTVTLNTSLQLKERSDLTVNIKESVGDTILKALLNTLMGMGTVFVVLIFISFLISLMAYIPKLIAKKAEEPAPQQAQSVAAVEEEVEVEVEDDSELVAVITAAIMASMGDEAPADGLVVRSIRKVNRSKWKNA